MAYTQGENTDCNPVVVASIATYASTMLLLLDEERSLLNFAARIVTWWERYGRFF